MSDKFNELIELIISEETDQAKALFHDIVVDKSRSIYESLIDETEEDEELEESDFDEELGGDAAEEFIDDISADEEGLALEDEDEDEEEMEDRVVDLEDALDELKAEFEKMMGGGDEDDMEMDMDMEPEMDDMEMDMEPEEDEEAEEDEEDEMDETIVREYTEKVAAPSNTSEKHVSPVAGKNDMGGSAKNIAQGGDENGAPAPTAKVNDAGNVNKPGAKVKPVAAPKPKA